jgi:hypothetical protein
MLGTLCASDPANIAHFEKWKPEQKGGETKAAHAAPLVGQPEKCSVCRKDCASSRDGCSDCQLTIAESLKSRPLASGASAMVKWSEQLEMLKTMGFDAQEANAALNRANGNYQQAISDLIQDI